MVLSTSTTRSLLAAWASSAVIAGAAHAQTQPPSASAFDSYKPYTDEPLANWKAANDTTARIGGWREYAKQAQAKEQEQPGKPANTLVLPTTPATRAGDASVQPVKKAKP